MPARVLHSDRVAPGPKETSASFTNPARPLNEREHTDKGETMLALNTMQPNALQPPRNSERKSPHQRKAKPLGSVKLADPPQGSKSPHWDQCEDPRGNKGPGKALKSLLGAHKDPPPKRGRKKKADSDQNQQTKIKKPRVTKALVNDAEVKPKPVKTRSTKSRKRKSAIISTLLADDHDVLHEPETAGSISKQSSRRRSHWTPVKDTEDKTRERLDDDDYEGKHRGLLFGGYGFSVVTEGSHMGQKTQTTAENSVAFKKRKIELVNGLSYAPVVEKKSRSTSPKKKPQTITDKATAPFTGPNKESDTSLRRYFGEPPLTENDADTSMQRQELDSQCKRKQAKKKDTAKKSAKKSAEPIVLHSPETAMKYAKNQDYLFGTSSQLARDESPDFLRNLQQALKESERESESCKTSHEVDAFLDIPTTIKRPSKALAWTPSRNLWSAAARDFNQALLDAEILDLTKTPIPSKSTNDPRALDHTANCESIFATNSAKVSEKPEWSDELSTSAPDDSEESLKPLPSLTAETSSKHFQKHITAAPDGDSVRAKTRNLPDYEGYTDIELRKKVVAFGFKPVRRRTAMIAVLERCWKSQNETALEENPKNVNSLLSNQDFRSEGSPARPTKSKRKAGNSEQGIPGANIPDSSLLPRPRGRPKKDPTSAKGFLKRTMKTKPESPAQQEAAPTQPEVSNDEETPKAPIPRKQRLPSRTLMEQPSSPLDIDPLTPLPAKDSAAYAQRISISIMKAVTNQSPTNDPNNLSWREKLLMYEPIVVEDLAIWLNKDGLGKVGEDDEVGPWQVKTWCESRSICCLWKENLKGGQRGRW
ncbi:MAG: 5'-flap endonuclease [Ramalina farinacea]|uniref:Structure-specific endonuclease subunit SLX4 n=1 Tax=Ramalina farinacea TaxID=258253 RepID=A0AA43QPD1_9LECA|nr:5'-flap endonuclease [Ramalina farinacea]